MPRPSRCSAEFQEAQLEDPICVGCGGFIPDGLSRRSGGKAPRPMWATIPRLKIPAAPVGAGRSNPPVVVDRFNRTFTGNWPAIEAAKRINRPDKNLPDLSEVGVQGFFDDDEW